MLLLQQCQQFSPQHVVIVDEIAAKQFINQAKAVNLNCEIHVGVQKHLSKYIPAKKSLSIVRDVINQIGHLLPISCLLYI